MTATMEAEHGTAPEEEEESTSVTEDTNATMGNVSGRNNGVVWSSHCFPPRLQQCTQSNPTIHSLTMQTTATILLF